MIKDYTYPIEISNRIIYFRKKIGLTQEELALKANISRSHLGRIERKECIPGISILRKLEVAMDLPPSSLIVSAPAFPPRNKSQDNVFLDHIANIIESHCCSANELILIEKAMLKFIEFLHMDIS